MSLDGVEDAFALTPVQHGMLYHSLQAGAGEGEASSDDYLSHIVMALSGPRDITLLKAAWQHVYSRHATLRTFFLWEGLDEPLQLVRAAVDILWDVRQATGQDEIEGVVLAERERGISLTTAPLSRFTLLEFSPTEATLVWTVHHLLADGWSTPVVLADFFHAYSALQRGVTPQLEPSLPYQQFVNWQAARSQDVARDYWQQWLSARTATRTPIRTPTPLQFPRPPYLATHKPGRQRASLSVDETTRLATFCRQHRMTLGTLVTGAWALALRSLTSSDSPLFGLTVAGRPAELRGIEQAVGLFINVLPVQVTCNAEDTLGSWLAAVQRTVQQHVAHEQLPFRDIQQLASHGSDEPLIDTVIAIEGHDGDIRFSTDDGTLSISDLDYHIQSHFPVSLLVMPGAALSLTIVHDTHRISESRATQMLSVVGRVLQLIADPVNATVGDVTGALQRQMAVQKQAIGKPLKNLFADNLVKQIQSVVDADPLAIAVIDETRSLSYQQLDKRSNQVAHAILASPRAAVADVVAIALPGGADQLIAMLGVLKAGKAYLPVDPTYPDSRITAMFSSAGVKMAITDNAGAERLPSDMEILTVGKMSAFAVHRPDLSIDRESLAYVMFTSGSTGTSKGVEISHANLLHSTSSRHAFYGVGKPRYLLLSSISFDSSVAGIYWSLCGGGCLVLPPADGHRDVAKIATLCDAHAITHTLCLPTVYQLLVDYAEPAQLASLKAVIVAGEACSPDLVKSHQQKYPKIALYNEYGPTEATVWSTVHALHAATDTGAISPDPVVGQMLDVPIGQPIPGASVWVLNDAGLPCPGNVLGEIHIAGDGLARGYRSAPDTTAERFIHRELEGELIRLYRTGDRGYWDDNRLLRFQGRMDRQVKVRGFRVDPAEIEVVLERHAQIEECVVITRPINERSTVLRLIAFYTGTGVVEPDELRDLVKTHLPAHCCPGVFHALDAMPRLLNGKISEHALPPLVSRRADTSSTDGAVPEGVAKQVLGIVTEAIGDALIEGDVSMLDNFFALGGDSISAMRVCAEIQHVTGVNLPLNQFFECDSLEQVAQRVEQVDKLRVEQRPVGQAESGNADDMESGEI